MSDNEKPETKSARSNQQRIFPVKQWRRRKKNRKNYNSNI